MLTRPVSDYATERKTLSSTEVPLCSVSDTATERKTLSTIKVPLCSMLGRVTRAMSVALLLRNNPKRKKSNFRSPAPPPCSVQLHLPLDLAGTLCGVCPYLSHTVNTCKQRTSTATTIQVYCSVACAWSAGIIT